MDGSSGTGARVAMSVGLERHHVNMTSVVPAAASLGRIRIRLLGGTSSLALSIASAVLALGVALSGEARAQTTVNPNQTTTYNLTPGNNPIIFGSTTQINTTGGVGFFRNRPPAVFGDVGTPWSVTVQNGATIAGAYGLILGSKSTLTNAGAISGNYQVGVWLRAGGSVTNSGTISGNFAGVLIQGGGSMANRGSISGNIAGVFLQDGGGMTNSGSISGNTIGVLVQVGGSVTNSGVISARTGISTYSLSSSSITVTNAGTITGTAGTALQFGGAGATTNTLILQTGSVLNGDAVGSTVVGSTNALILQGIGAANNNFLNFNMLDVQAGGVWALNGVSAIGATTVSGGTLAIGDAAHPGAALTSPVTVAAGGTLAGQGSVIGDVTMLGGGAVAPGAASPFSTLNVTGNATFANGSFYRVNVNAAGQTDKLTIGGTAMLTGGSVQASLAPGSYVVRSYDILHASGGLGGTTFSGISDILPGFSESLSYTPTDVFLNLTAAQLGAGGGLGRNQQNVATAINNFFNTGGTLPAGFVPLFNLTGGNLAAALSQSSGEVSTGVQQGAFQLMTGFLGLMVDPSVDGRGGFGGAVRAGARRAAAGHRAGLCQGHEGAAIPGAKLRAALERVGLGLWRRQPHQRRSRGGRKPRSFRHRRRGRGGRRLSSHTRRADRLRAGRRRH
jgi:hypothetical protein